MRTLLLLLAIWGVLGLIQCNKEDLPTQSHDVKLRVNESAQLNVAGSKLKVTLKQLRDSRCPANIECVWPGQTEVVAELRNTTEASQMATLCLGACRNDSVAVRLGSRSHALKLQTVTPYPTLPQQPDLRPVAHLRLTQQ